jgi:Periplasmic copper-binding protein (NosD)
MPVYIDPTVSGTGTGTYGDPFRSWSSVTWTAGQTYLQKQGTTFQGTVAIGAPGTAGNLITVGTYRASDGAESIDETSRAMIATTGATDAVFSNGHSYVTCRGLTLETGGGFPYAGFRAVSASFVTVEDCTIASRVGSTTGSYGIRIDNPTGAAAARSSWTVRRNRINRTTGNAGILLIWGANTGENVTDILVEENDLTGMPYVSGSSPHGIQIQGRATTIYTDRSGLCGKGVRVNRNRVRNVAGYGAIIQDVMAGGTMTNQAIGNTIIGIGDGQFDVHCLGIQGVQDLLCMDNLIGESYAYQGGTTGTGVGIFIDTPTLDSRDGCDRIKVLRNRIYRTGQNASDGLEAGGAGIFVLSSREIDVRYNEVLDSKNGIVVQGGSPAAHASQTVNVENNTIARCERNGIMSYGAADLVVVRNNSVRGCAAGIYLQTSVQAVTNYTETNNSVYDCTLSYTSGDAPDGTTEAARTPSGTNTTTDPVSTDEGKPMLDSPLLTDGYDAGYVRDIDNRQGRGFIGAYTAARLVEPI